MEKPMTCKELAEILLNTPDKPVMIAKAEVNGDLDGVWLEDHREYLDKQYIILQIKKSSGCQSHSQAICATA